MHATDHPKALIFMHRAYKQAVMPKEIPEQLSFIFEEQGITIENQEASILVKNLNSQKSELLDIWVKPTVANLQGLIVFTTLGLIYIKLFR